MVALALWMCGAGAGCQSYSARPLDLDASRTAFLSRLPDAPAVRLLGDVQPPPGGPFDVADGLSLGEGELVALVFNPDLRVARLGAGVAAAGAEHAGLWDDPSIGVDVARILESVSNPWIVMTTLRLTIPISGRLEVERRLAGAEHDTELVRVARSEWATRLALRRAWHEWGSMRRNVEIAAEFLSRLEAVVSIVDRLEQAGELARIQGRLFHLELATRRADVRAMEARTAAAEQRVRAILGLAPEAPVTLVPASGDPPRLPPATERRALIEAQSPDLAEARAMYEGAERSLELEIRRQYPDLTIGPGYESHQGENRLRFGLDLPLPVLNANRRGIAEARARREQAHAVFEATLERLFGRLASAEAELAAAGVQREALEHEIVPLADKQYAEARAIAELGEVDTLLLLETLGRQEAARLQCNGARLAESLAALEIEELLGPTPSSGAGRPGAAVPNHAEDLP